MTRQVARRGQAGDGPVHAGIPEHGRVPRYYAVKVRLLDLLGELGEGAVLPTERELAERFGCSRASVRQAVGDLVLEGRLRRRQGSGTFVAGPKLVQPLALVSYTEGLRRQGVEPGRSLVTLERVTAGETLAGELRLEPGAEMIHIERVLLADGERVGLESTYLVADRFPTLLEVFDPAQSLYACLRDKLGVVFAGAEERVETMLATPREALLIGTNPALPMLLMHRVSWGPDGVPFERVRSLYRGDRLSFTTRLNPTP
ncbi:GntR family transcriptional regulator [Amycolatopsis cynarae]|uniref:GntR family transcriptional regulator n=1 Tax=Amycolatopsis cynarae TaxID=2995223 RepID=A0ABY7AW06_9PSEU|nr:GntR family transcriptional regulator [Amycolatopsis sp. HUAS 11-8]WAL64131.1 GntR family transcriptional regulator [Amycolatopsis sp. HUAS 11-8]